MKRQWQIWREKFETLEQRERLLIVGALLALVFLLGDYVLIQPAVETIEQLDARERSAEQAISRAEAGKTVLNNLAQTDPNDNLKRELTRLEAQIKALDRELNEVSAGLVSAEQLPLVFKTLLSSSAGIELLQMQTLAPSAVELRSESAPGAPANEASKKNEQATAIGEQTNDALTLFRHDVRIILTGGFRAVLQYLTKLEQSHWQFYWQSMEYEVTRYPKARVVLNVFTLSADKGR